MSVLLMLQTSADRAVQPQEKPSFSGLWSRGGLMEWLCQGLEMMTLSSSLMTAHLILRRVERTSHTANAVF